MAGFFNSEKLQNQGLNLPWCDTLTPRLDGDIKYFPNCPGRQLFLKFLKPGDNRAPKAFLNQQTFLKDFGILNQPGSIFLSGEFPFPN